MNTYIPDKANRESVQTIVTRRHDVTGCSIAWTDGSCEPNPGPGGWGVVIEDGPRYSGNAIDTTNNQMELIAIIESIERTSGPLIVRTDSQLCVLCFVGRWARKKNKDLWSRLHVAAHRRHVMIEWWRGHCGTVGNELADELAVIARQSVIDADASHIRSILRER